MNCSSNYKIDKGNKCCVIFFVNFLISLFDSYFDIEK